jgi:hypothetical protein
MKGVDFASSSVQCSGVTPLHVVASASRFELMQLMHVLDPTHFLASLYLKDKGEESPLSLARGPCKAWMEMLLLERRTLNKFLDRIARWIKRGKDRVERKSTLLSSLKAEETCKVESKDETAKWSFTEVSKGPSIAFSNSGGKSSKERVYSSSSRERDGIVILSRFRVKGRRKTVIR